MNQLFGLQHRGVWNDVLYDNSVSALIWRATRAELNTLLQSKLSDVLTEEQKIRKIGNMLSALKKQGVIKLVEKKKWVLVEV